MIKQMRYFQAVVRCRNFTEAAEECNISQSAVSQQIQALERELGVKLLNRDRRKFSLTPAGEHFYRKSLILIHDFDRLCEETKLLDQGIKQVFTVGYPRQYHGTELQQIIPEFRQKYPHLPLYLVSGTHDDLYNLLREGKADLVFNDLRRQPADKYVNQFLIQEKVYVELPETSYLGQLSDITMDDLKNTPCIIITTPAQQSADEAFYRDYFGVQGDFVQAANLEEAQLFVLSNQGYYLSECRQPVNADNSGIQLLPLMKDGKQVTRDYYAFWNKEQTEEYIADFVAMFEEKLGK